jgi:succinyl-CoA synthetase beta subunit
MILLESDAKAIMAERGIRVPRGVLVRSPSDLPADFPLPLMVKAQVPVGGRGKSGGIVAAADAPALERALRRMVGATIRGHLVRECLVEEMATGRECFIGFALDEASGNVNVLLSANGGVDVEVDARRHMMAERVDFDPAACRDAALRLAVRAPEPMRAAFSDIAPRLVAMFFSLDAILVEVNPLFVQPDGSWIAGDAKLCVDDNALARQPGLAALIRSRASAYPETARKLASGFDFAVLDADGDVGLVTTGAGLTMQIIDELTARGCRPLNFCDIRTGEFRGDPARLIQVFEILAAAPSIKTILINFFAGITHLGEVARLIVAALEAVPRLAVPITARLIGNGYDDAVAVLGAMPAPLTVEPDLERALDRVVAAVARKRA